MSFSEAVATQPQWVQIWLNILLFGAFIMPFGLLVFKETRILGLVFLAVTFLGAFTIVALYDIQGYTRILGLPHLIIWIPAAILILRKLRTPLRMIPRGILIVILVTISISLVFDVYDVARYILGDRASMIPT